MISTIVTLRWGREAGDWHVGRAQRAFVINLIGKPCQENKEGGRKETKAKGVFLQ